MKILFLFAELCIPFLANSFLTSTNSLQLQRQTQKIRELPEISVNAINTFSGWRKIHHGTLLAAVPENPRDVKRTRSYFPLRKNFPTTNFDESNKKNIENDDDDDDNDFDFSDGEDARDFFPNTNHNIRNNKETRNEKYKKSFKNQSKKSDNFEILNNNKYSFKDIGGCDLIKTELYQCIDILKNPNKYLKYNVRVPRGLLLEGPPGNGKTLIAKAISGEANTSFIAVSGSEFQDKYVGVGQGKVRELFKFARENKPCIIFIDEIDAIGRKRSGDGEFSSSEKDSTLNELLVALDGFKENNGVFLIGATNRADILDPALLRPGRIDKKIFIGSPDEKTRKHIIEIHISGKSFSKSVEIDNLVELTDGFSGAQIENILNEAMLNALRNNETQFSIEDVNLIVQKTTVGWQPTEHEMTESMLECISVHELGHAIIGLKCIRHSQVKSVIINLHSPNSPGYTVFYPSKNSILNKEELFEHMMILLAGRIAEEVVYGKEAVSSGAINDFEEARKLAEKMIVYYGMGDSLIYPAFSEKYKEKIDEEIDSLIDSAYKNVHNVLIDSKEKILFWAKILMRKRELNKDELDLIRGVSKFL